MSRVMLFDGLEECISLCEKLSSLDVIIDVYGEYESIKETYPNKNNIHIHITELDADIIRLEYERLEPDVVVDGAHIADVSVHEIIKETVPNKKYIRLREEREKLDVAYCDNMSDVVAMVNRTRSNIYFTTGDMGLEGISAVVDSRKRVYIDLPKGNVFLRRAAASGISVSRINDIFDYTEEELIGIIKDNGIKYIVVREDESRARIKMMYSAAKKTNIIMIVLRPEEDCFTVDEVITKIKSIDTVKQVYIIGTGAGNPKNMTVEACEAIEKCEVVIGSEELIKLLGIKDKEFHFAQKTEDIKEFINSHFYSRLAVVTQGDVCLLNGIAEFTREMKGYNVIVVQGVSSIAYLAARLGIDWINCVTVDSTKDNVLKAVAENRGVFVFTDGNTNTVLKMLNDNGFENVAVCIAERLSLSDEKITTGYVYELADGKYDALTVMYFENPKYGKASSILKEDSIITGNMHILNRNIRAVVMRDMDLRANEVVYDIGAGCGAMAVEMALISNRSRIYAMDKSELAVDLIERNCSLYTVNNVRAILGDAMEITGSLPKPDAVLIEGYDGNVIDLVKCIGRLNEIRLVVVTRGFDNAYKLMELMHKNYFENIEIKQISVNEGENYGNGTNMEHKDTCFIIKGTGEITG
ncbi:MAG: precorrin-6Y C5,15-methyltransferase (decarboxylating) subunit CbiT [Clostridia bacterium]|nr:precorrin-6Y C5,15-methyltransferase (decarboxylating) subunit CbiT [Clostridia bacterium]